MNSVEQLRKSVSEQSSEYLNRCIKELAGISMKLPISDPRLVEKCRIFYESLTAEEAASVGQVAPVCPIGVALSRVWISKSVELIREELTQRGD